MRKYSVFIIIAIVIASLFIVKSFFFPTPNEGNAKSSDGKKMDTPALAVDIIVLKNQKAANEIQSTGTVLANEKVELASEGSGKVIGIYFKEGSYIGKIK